ncbi:hypothetical protein BDFB_005920, partial [Asbolus verrucosus]
FLHVDDENIFLYISLNTLNPTKQMDELFNIINIDDILCGAYFTRYFIIFYRLFHRYKATFSITVGLFMHPHRRLNAYNLENNRQFLRLRAANCREFQLISTNPGHFILKRVVYPPINTAARRNSRPRTSPCIIRNTTTTRMGAR